MSARQTAPRLAAAALLALILPTAAVAQGNLSVQGLGYPSPWTLRFQGLGYPPGALSARSLGG